MIDKAPGTCPHYWIVTNRAKRSLFVDCSECGAVGIVRLLGASERVEAAVARMRYPWRDRNRVTLISNNRD
jgi:hypothetical protein